MYTLKKEVQGNLKTVTEELWEKVWNEIKRIQKESGVPVEWIKLKQHSEDENKIIVCIDPPDWIKNNEKK